MYASIHVRTWGCGLFTRRADKAIHNEPSRVGGQAIRLSVHFVLSIVQ